MTIDSNREVYTRPDGSTIDAYRYIDGNGTVFWLEYATSHLLAVVWPDGRTETAGGLVDKDTCPTCRHKPLTRFSTFNVGTGVRDPYRTCSACGWTADG